jgi:hypothetical protein
MWNIEARNIFRQSRDNIKNEKECFSFFYLITEQ